MRSEAARAASVESQAAAGLAQAAASLEDTFDACAALTPPQASRRARVGFATTPPGGYSVLRSIGSIARIDIEPATLSVHSGGMQDALIDKQPADGEQHELSYNDKVTLILVVSFFIIAGGVGFAYTLSDTWKRATEHD